MGKTKIMMGDILIMEDGERPWLEIAEAKCACGWVCQCRFVKGTYWMMPALEEVERLKMNHSCKPPEKEREG